MYVVLEVILKRKLEICFALAECIMILYILVFIFSSQVTSAKKLPSSWSIRST